MPSTRLLEFIELVISTAQAGLTFSKDSFDIERYLTLRQTATEILAHHENLAPAEVGRWLALDNGYPTPKLDVRAMIMDEHEQIFLVREKADARWTLPGGWCDIGRSAAEAVVREVREEAGLQVAPVRLLALLDKHKQRHPPQMPHAYKAFFLCQVEGGALLQSTAETSGAAYFRAAALPELSLDRVLPGQIQALHARVLAGHAAALFD